MNGITPENSNSENQIPKANEKIYYSPGKIGLFIGIPSFFLASFVTLGVGLCGNILLSISIGAIAGWATAHYSEIGFWANASEFGGKAGRIAGVFILLGTIAAGVASILFLKIGSASGIFTLKDVSGFAELTSGFIRRGIINGMIGLIIAWSVASAVSSKVYEKVQRESLR